MVFHAIVWKTCNKGNIIATVNKANLPWSIRPLVYEHTDNHQTIQIDVSHSISWRNDHRQLFNKGWFILYGFSFYSLTSNTYHWRRILMCIVLSLINTGYRCSIHCLFQRKWLQFRICHEVRGCSQLPLVNAIVMPMEQFTSCTRCKEMFSVHVNIT